MTAPDDGAQLRYLAALILKHTFDQTHGQDGKPLWSWTVQDAGFAWFNADQFSQAMRLVYEMAGLLQRYVPDDIKRELSGLLQCEIHNAVVDGGGSAL